MMKLTRTLVINDLHIPYHDKALVELVLYAASDIKIDRIIINGDMLDFYNINMHGPTNPIVQETLLDEMIAGREFLEGLRKQFKDAEIVFLAGNHEHRLDRYILKNSKVFWNILNVENMLTLEALNIEYHAYNYCYQLEKTNLFIQHSPPSYGENGARTSLLKKMDSSFIFGCTHRKQISCMTGHSGEVYTVYFNGWLGSTTLTPSHKEVFSFARGHENWQHTASIVNVIGEREFFVNQLEIKNNRLLLDGAVYEA